MGWLEVGCLPGQTEGGWREGDKDWGGESGGEKKKEEEEEGEEEEKAWGGGGEGKEEGRGEERQTFFWEWEKSAAKAFHLTSSFCLAPITFTSCSAKFRLPKWSSFILLN